MNPLMWYNDNFCKKCKEKTCRRTSGGVFYEDTLGSKINFMQLWFEIGLQDQTLHIPFSVPIKVPETTDIVMSVLGDGVSANSICFGAVRGWLTNA